MLFSFARLLGFRSQNKAFAPFCLGIRVLSVIFLLNTFCVFSLEEAAAADDTPTAQAERVAAAQNFLRTQLSADNPDPHGGVGYRGNRRAIFGEPWLDVDGNGCDTRNDILARDLENVDFSPRAGQQNRAAGKGAGVASCPDATVYSGKLRDPYTGKEIEFRRGAQSSAQVQIDHIIPLAYAYMHGGWELAQKGEKNLLQEFANDPVNLRAVSGAANKEKSAAGPAQWLPENRDFHCEYALEMVAVLEKYNSRGFTLAPADRKALLDILDNSCSGARGKIGAIRQQMVENMPIVIFLGGGAVVIIFFFKEPRRSKKSVIYKKR